MINTLGHFPYLKLFIIAFWDTKMRKRRWPANWRAKPGQIAVHGCARWAGSVLVAVL